MKKLICIAAIFLIPLLAQNKNNEIKISNKTEILKVNNERTSVAAVPRKVAYQGILTKDNGQPADDRMYSVKFRLYNLLEGGEPFWEESQIIFINDGLLSATVGVYNELNKIPANAFLEVEVGGSVLEPRQEMTSVFYSIISDTSYFAKGYTRTEDLPPVSLSGEYSDLKNIPDTLIADVFIGSASGLTGILADSVGVLSGSTPIVFDGETNDNNKIFLTVEEPTSNQEILIPNTSGTLLTTGNDQLIDEVGIIHSGVWMGDEIEDTFIDNDLSILDGEINATPIGNSVPSSANFTSLTTEDGLKIYNGNIDLSNDELNVLDSVVHGQASPARALVVDSEKDIDGLRNINATGTINAESFAGMFMGDGSGITGVSANSIKSDDLTPGDAAVTISTSTGGINLTPAAGSMIVLDGSVSVDEGIVSGITSLTAGTINDGTATLSNGALSGATTITGSGAITGGSLIVDEILINRSEIGHIQNSDLITLSANQVLVDGGVTVGTLNIGGTNITATANELNYVDGVTSNIQTQLDSKTGITTSQASAITANTAKVGYTDDLVAANSAVAANTAKTGITTDQASLIDAITSTATELNILDGVTSTTAELNLLDGVTATTAELNVLDGALKETNSIWIGSEPSSTTDDAEYNVAVGTTALDAITTGDSNTALGYNTLTANLAGNRNTAIGSGALKSNTTGITNVAVGSSALESNTTANSNTAVGHASSFKLASGQNNVTLGYEASKNMTSANNNVIVGSDANPSADTGTSNQIVIGYNTIGKANNTVTIGNGDITTWTPTDDGEVDLGSSSVEFKDLYVDGVAYTDAIGFGSTAMTLPTADGSNGQVLVTDGGGALSWSSTAGNATRASTLTITDNENTNESNALIFTAGGDIDGGNLGLESDGDATYNPSTGVITATGFSGNLTGTLQTASQTNVTSLGTLSGLTVSGEASVTTLDIGGIDVTSTAAELNLLDGVTSTTSELNYVDGVTSNIQAQLDSKSSIAEFDDLTDAKSGGSNFSNSMILGHQTTGTLNNADENIGLGIGSLESITSGDRNTAIGKDAMNSNTEGNYNTSSGYQSLYVNTTGSFNVAVGNSSLGLNVNGNSNIGLGHRALNSNTSGDLNVAIGRKALYSTTTSQYNLAVGTYALEDANRTADTDGYNVALGYNSGNTGTNDITTGNKNTLLGSLTAASAAAGTNQTVIGYGASGKGNNTVAIGNGDITLWSASDDGEVDLGSSSIEFKDLYLDGVAYVDGLDLNGTIISATAAELNYVDGVTSNIQTQLNAKGVGSVSALSDLSVTSTATELNILDGVTSTTAELNLLDGVTSTTTELNYVDGVTSNIQTQLNAKGVGSVSALSDLSVTSTATELNILDGVTSTTAELNLLDGGTSASSTTIVDADRLVLNDNGTMVQVAVSDLGTYMASNSSLDVLTDSKSGGTNFTGSLIVGHQNTGTLDAADNNTGVGLTALDAVSTGDGNTAVGYNALTANTTGEGNVAIGYNTLAANTTASQNLGMGYNALAIQTSDGAFNTAVGSYTLDNNTIGDKNVALGYVALTQNSEGSNNVGIGSSSSKSNSTGSSNTSAGNSSLYSNTSANYNTAIGAEALYDANRTADTDGYNTALGYNAGNTGNNDLTTGNKNTLLGASTAASAAAGTNQTVIGYGASGQADNSVTLGDANVTAVYMAQDKGATVHAAGISLENNETITNSTDTQIDMSSTTLVVGNGSTDPTIKSNGNKDLTLQTGASNTGSIVIRDGSDNNIDIAPHGTGKIDLNDSPLTGFGADISAESGTSKTLAATDNGTIINCSNGSAITITVPTSLPTGFNCLIIQSGSGQVTLSASSTTLNNRNGLKTAGQHAIMTLVHLGSNVFVVSGDTSSS